MSFVDRTMRFLDDVDRVSSAFSLNKLDGISPALIGLSPPPRRSFKEHEDKYVLTLDVPGVRKEDIQIEMEGDGSILIKTQTETGSYEYCLQTLPKNIDTTRMMAKLDLGVLELQLMKKENSKKTIPISLE